MVRWYAAALGIVLGCGRGDDPPVDVTESCAPPSRVVGDRCLAPGVQDDGCPAGTLGAGDGSCRPAGVMPELCAEGFVHDGDASCEPILPDAACPPGQMAIPGETACRPVRSCGAGTWGEIPVDGTTVYVDRTYGGGDSDGSARKPWTSVTQAIAAAPAGALIAVAAGNYPEDLVITKRVRLWGICPERVTIAGTGADLGALYLQPGSSGSELVGFAVTSATVGILVTGAEDVLVADVWVHDALGRGVDIEDPLGPASVTLQNALVEGNHEFGVFVQGARVIVEGVVARGNLPHAGNQSFGRGISIRDNPDTRAPADMQLRRSLVEDNYDLGVYVGGSQATLEGVVVRRTSPQASDLQSGRGISLQESVETAVPSGAILRGALVEDCHDVGVYVAGSEVTLEGLVVRRTLPQPFDELRGRGLNIQLSNESGAPATATVRGSLVEDTHDVGVIVAGSNATIEGLLVRRTSTRPLDGEYGVGLALASDQYTGAPSTVRVRGSRIEHSATAAVIVDASDVTLEAIVARETLPSDTGLFGDGISVSSATFGLAGATVTHSVVDRNARAGISNFGARVTLEASALSNNAFDLDGERIHELPYAFDDRGGNGCGSPQPTGACTVRSSGLEPPEPPSH